MSIYTAAISKDSGKVRVQYFENHSERPVRDDYTDEVTIIGFRDLDGVTGYIIDTGFNHIRVDEVRGVRIGNNNTETVTIRA